MKTPWFAAICLTAAACIAAAAHPIQIRLAPMPGIGHLLPDLAKGLGYFQDEGINVECVNVTNYVPDDFYAGDMVLQPDGRAPVLDAISWYAGNASQHYAGHTVYGTAVWPDKKWHYAPQRAPPEYFHEGSESLGTLRHARQCGRMVRGLERIAPGRDRLR